MLKDIAVIKIESGKGGNGSMASRANRFVGGDGGKGGDVFLKGSNHIYDLGDFDNQKIIRADNGEPGQKLNLKGANAKHLYIELPLTTEVYIGGDLAHLIDSPDKVVKVASGGFGKMGSSRRKREGFDPNEAERAASKKVSAKLVLKLQADAIFIGYPNAGKSSLLNSLTNARVKTASYAFTTIDPQIALMDGLRLMDLPGLIEGTYEGKGLGTQFVKHTENSKLVVHFVSLEEEDPMKAYLSMRGELKNIGSDLHKKPEIICLSKTDEYDGDLSKIEESFRALGLEVVSTSIIDDDSIASLKSLIVNSL